MVKYRGFRKARASVLAVDERQKLETLNRDEKTANRTLTQLSERQQGLEEKIAVRKNDLSAQAVKKEEVCWPFHDSFDFALLLSLDSWRIK